jgi:hypothetical protein
MTTDADSKLEQRPIATIRPTRSVVLARLIASILLLVIAISGWVLDIRFLPVALIALAAIGLVSSLRDLVGRVKSGPDGISFRRRQIAWDDVFQFVVIVRPWSRRAEVDVNTGGTPRRLRLPAPATSQLFPDRAFDRDIGRLRSWAGVTDKTAAAPTRAGFGNAVSGWLLVAAAVLVPLVFDRPLGWYGGPQAATVPSACAALTPTLASSIGTTSRPPSTPSGLTDDCEWDFPGGGLSLTYERFVRHGLHSGTDQAQYQETLIRHGNTGSNGTANNILARPASRSVPGVPAPVLIYPDGGGMQVLTNRGNILINIRIGAPSLDAATEHALAVLTNAAIANVHLH